MAVSRLKTSVIALGLVLGVPLAAHGAMAVIDGTAIGKLIEQIKQMKQQYATELEQLEELQETVKFLNDIHKLSADISDAIGKIGRITIPLPNLDKIGAQTKSNLRCLMPDGASLKWGIKTEDINLGSICDTSSKYRSALFADPELMAGLTYAEQEVKRVKTISNRIALLEDTTTRSLALSDVMLKQADEFNKTADDLQSSLDNSEKLQDRQHVEAQINLARLRADAQQAQTLAQMLRLQSAVAVFMGLPTDKVKEIAGKTGQ